MREPRADADEGADAGAVVVAFDPGRRRGRPTAPPVERRAEPRPPSPRHARLTRLVVLLAVAILGAVALGPRLLRADLPTAPELLGTPARGVIKADRDYALVDNSSTVEHRRRAAEAALPVWDLDDVGGQRDSQAIHKALLRTAVAIEGHRRAARDERREASDDVTVAMRSFEDVRAVVAGELAAIGLEAPPDAEWRALFTVLWSAPRAANALASAAGSAL
jgi:hypothetical protein